MNLIEDFMIGISKKLGTFEIPVYIDEVKTNLTTPSFLVRLINHTHVRYPSDRYKKKFPFELIYFPDTRKNKSVNSEIYEVISKLNYLMQVVELEDGTLVRGMNMDHMLEDNTLHFYVTYSTFVRLVKDEYYMSDIIQKNGVED